MQAELELEETQQPIQILGVDGLEVEAVSEGMTAGRALPWLQPTADKDVWTLWEVEYRDVVVLGPGNEKLCTYNLTEHNLSDPANYAALKEQLLEAAGM